MRAFRESRYFLMRPSRFGVERQVAEPQSMALRKGAQDCCQALGLAAVKLMMRTRQQAELSDGAAGC